MRLPLHRSASWPLRTTPAPARCDSCGAPEKPEPVVWTDTPVRTAASRHHPPLPLSGRRTALPALLAACVAVLALAACGNAARRGVSPAVGAAPAAVRVPRDGGAAVPQQQQQKEKQEQEPLWAPPPVYVDAGTLRTEATADEMEDAARRLGAQRAAGLQRCRRERATRYADAIEVPAAREVVRDICARFDGGGVPRSSEELDDMRWMCEKRGARLASRMRAHFRDGLTGEKYARMHEEYAASPAEGHTAPLDGALHAWVRDGHVAAWTAIVGAQGVAQGIYEAAALQRLRRGRLPPHNTTAPGQDFNLFLLFGDATDRSASSTRNPALPPRGVPPGVPVVRFCVSRHDDPHHIALPYVEDFQGFPAHDHSEDSAQAASFDSLPDTVVWRGSYYNDYRGHLSILSALGAFGGAVDASVSAVSGRGGERCVRQYAALKRAGLLPAEAHRTDSSVLCREESGGMWGAPGRERVSFEEMKRAKYVLSVDGVGAVLRLPHLLRGPGVVLGMTDEFEEYYFPDVVPFVHYVPVEKEAGQLYRNVSETLRLLRGSPEVSRSIATESTRWARLHKNEATDFLQWKLFFGLSSAAFSGPLDLPAHLAEHVRDAAAEADQEEVNRLVRQEDLQGAFTFEEDTEHLENARNAAEIFVP